MLFSVVLISVGKEHNWFYVFLELPTRSMLGSQASKEQQAHWMKVLLSDIIIFDAYQCGKRTQSILCCLRITCNINA